MHQITSLNNSSGIDWFNTELSISILILYFKQHSFSNILRSICKGLFSIISVTENGRVLLQP